MNWRVRECPLLNIYIYMWYLRLNKYDTTGPDNMLCIRNPQSDNDDNDFDGRGIAKLNGKCSICFLLLLHLLMFWLCVTLMPSTHVSRGNSCAHTMCAGIALYRTRTANVNKCPSTRLKSIYVQSIFHLCQFKLIETKWKLSADFYTSFSAVAFCRGSCLISLTAAVRRCILLSILLLLFVRVLSRIRVRTDDARMSTRSLYAKMLSHNGTHTHKRAVASAENENDIDLINVAWISIVYIERLIVVYFVGFCFNAFYS